MRRAIEFEEVAFGAHTDSDWFFGCDSFCDCCYDGYDDEEEEPDELTMVGRLLLATPTLGDLKSVAALRL